MCNEGWPRAFKGLFKGASNALMTKMWPAICHQLSSPIEGKPLVAGKQRRRAQKMAKWPGLTIAEERYAAYKEVLQKQMQIFIFSTGFQGTAALFN